MKSPSLAKQAGILAMALFIGRVLGFIYRLPLTHLIGDEGNAWYSTAYSVYVVIAVFAAIALPAAVSKLVAERMAKDQYRNAHGMFQTALTFSVVAGVVTAVAMWFGAGPIARFLGAPMAFYPMRAMAPAILLLWPMCAFRGYFLGTKTAFPVALSQIGDQVFNVGFSIFLAFVLFDAERLHRSVTGAAVGTSIGVVGGLLIVIGLYALVQKDFHRRMIKDLRPPFETERTQMKLLIATAVPIMLGMGIFALTTPLDFGMANARLAASGAFTTAEIDALVGQFGLKFLVLISLPIAMAGSLAIAVIPEISASGTLRDKRAVRESINTALRLAMLISLPAAVGLAVLADPILALLFPAFPEGGFLLRWGSSAIIFMVLNQIFASSLQGMGKVAMPVIAAIFGLAVKIPINYFLMAVPGIHVMGAVISTIVCFVIASGLNLFFMYRTTRIMPRFGEAFLKPVVASAVMGAACFILHRVLTILMPNAIATVLTLLLGIAVYLVAMLMLRGLHWGDVDLLPLPARAKRWLVR